jgi:hypothetical protein
MNNNEQMKETYDAVENDLQTLGDLTLEVCVRWQPMKSFSKWTWVSVNGATSWHPYDLCALAPVPIQMRPAAQ